MLEDQEHSAAEGLFDAQLSLPLGGTTRPEPFTTVVKRDGRAEPFDLAKIAEAIASASATVAPNEAEHALDLAKAVRVYLWKQLGSVPPHVDQIHAAVERVLVAMARQRTALAYARYRARRQRQRNVKSGGRLPLFVGLEDEDFARDALAGHPAALLVRTSADTLATWDRGKIVEALVRETGLAGSTAEAIALEVEQQIAAAHIDALTAPLIRELVDAKLAEHGLNEYRERHRRLGVPLYDTALVLRGATPSAMGASPEATGRLLAQTLKKEYALAEVFAAPVSEAHLRGDLHLEGLGEIDRYFAASLPLGGLHAQRDRAFALNTSPAHFLAGWRQTARTLQTCLQQPAAWLDIARGLAPVLGNLDDAAMLQLAEMIVVEFSGTGAAVPTSSPTCLHLAWPASKGASDAAGRLGSALIDTLKVVYEHEMRTDGLLLGVEIAAPLFTAFPPTGALQLLVRGAAAGVPMHVAFDRGDRAPVAGGGNAWLQSVAINLPRAAQHADALGGMRAWLTRQAQLAAQAHFDKQAFLLDLAERGDAGPLHALQGWEAFALSASPTRFALDGLHDAAQMLAPGGDTQAVAEEILQVAAAACREVAESTGAALCCSANTLAEVHARFAAVDGRPEPVGLRGCGIAWDTVDLPTVEAAAWHGTLSTYLDEPGPLVVESPSTAYAPESIADLVQQVLLRTACPAVELRLLAPETRRP